MKLYSVAISAKRKSDGSMQLVSACVPASSYDEAEKGARLGGEILFSSDDYSIEFVVAEVPAQVLAHAVQTVTEAANIISQKEISDNSKPKEWSKAK